MGLCGASDINVKDGVNTNLTYDLNGNQLDSTNLFSQNSLYKLNSIKTYNNNKVFEIEIEAFVGEREYPIYITKNSKIEINLSEDKNYLWAFLPKEKKIDFKGYSNYKYNDHNLGCLLLRISTSHDYIPVESNKFTFTSEEEGSLIFSANLDFSQSLLGSLKLIIKGGDIHDMKKIDELTDYNYKSINYKKKDEKAHSEIKLTISRYINKARNNIKKYINDFIIDYEPSMNLQKKMISSLIMKNYLH